MVDDKLLILKVLYTSSYLYEVYFFLAALGLMLLLVLCQIIKLVAMGFLKCHENHKRNPYF